MQAALGSLFNQVSSPAFTLPFNFVIICFYLTVLNTDRFHLTKRDGVGVLARDNSGAPVVSLDDFSCNICSAHRFAPALGSVRTGLIEENNGESVINFLTVTEALFRGVGQIYFADHWVSGVRASSLYTHAKNRFITTIARQLLMVIGMAVSSPISAMMAFLGSGIGLSYGMILGASGYALQHGLWGYNPSLTGMSAAAPI